MGQSLNKIYIHLVFSTKNRKPMISEDVQDDLFSYLGGICKNLECNPIQVGGYRNHVHILCLLSKKIALMNLIEKIKSNSSKWMKTKGVQFSDFYWQSGYGVFSVNPTVNPTEIEIVKQYILNQEEHHKKMSFQDEFLKFLKKYNVDYDERYVWD